MAIAVDNLPTQATLTGNELLACEASGTAKKIATKQLLGTAPMTVSVSTSTGVQNFSGIVGADNQALIASVFAYADANMPNVVVEFGPGDYRIDSGIIHEFSDSASGLTITGRQARLVLSGSQWSGSMVALRLMNTTQSKTDSSGWLQDFTIAGLGVYDDAPHVHAAASEETHGLGIGYCKRATISGCCIESVGDEGIELDYCHGGIVTDNHLNNCNNQEEGGGGAISIKNGCTDFSVTSNTVVGQIPDAWTAGTTYAARQRARGSDGKTYKSVADGNIGNDPTSTSPASWTDLSTLNAGKGPQAYGIAVKVIDAYEVRRGTIANNVIRDTEFAGIGLSTVGAGVFGLTVEGNAVSNSKYGVYFGTKPSNFTVVGNSFHDIDLSVFHLFPSTQCNGIGIYDNLIEDCIGVGFTCSSSMGDVGINGNMFINSGNTSDIFISPGSGSEKIDFNGNTVINCESGTIFMRYTSAIKNNAIDLASPSHQSIAFYGATTFTGNTINGALKGFTAGRITCANNTISIDYDFGTSSHAAIAFSSGYSHKGSIITGNTIINNSSTGSCINIGDEDSEAANVIVTDNHCGLGSDKTIVDGATGTVLANNVTS